MSNRPDWDKQFSETESELNKRLAKHKENRLTYDKGRRTIINESHPEKTGMFILHNCWRCKDGEKPCIIGNPRQCEYPHARND